MDSLPAELWLDILARACTDGGYTGCSLSLVSHSMRAMARPFRHQSISLVGPRQVQAFVELAVSTRPTNIRHLFLSIDLPLFTMTASQTSGRHSDVLKGWFRTILSIAAPTILTLFVHKIPIPVINVFNLCFPLLLNLSVDGFSYPDDPTKGDEFPSLERLQVGGCHTYELWDEVIRMAPSIAHIRVDDVRLTSELPLFFRDLLGIPTMSPHNVTPSFRRTPGSSQVRNAASIISKLPRLKIISVCPLPETLGANLRLVRQRDWSKCGLESLARVSESSTE